MPHSLKSENINNSFFQGYYKDIWRHIFPEKTTHAEADWIIACATLKPGNNVLDLMCGYGRHSLELGRRGINVTAIDNLREYINEIEEQALKNNLPIECSCLDVLEMDLNKEYDAVLCMGNSIQFFNEEDILRLFSNIATHLKVGGKIFINTWTIAEIAMKNFKEKTWSKVDNLVFMTESRFQFHPTRIETNSIIITEAGDREEKSAVDFVYSISEIEAMFNKTGFKMTDIYSIPGKKQFTLGEPRAYIVAEKFS